MAKSKKNVKDKILTLPSNIQNSDHTRISSSLSNTAKILILLILGLLFYANSIGNELAHDDGMVIENNAYVLRGVSGIGQILTHDAYQGVYEKIHSSQQLAGGRYRPLSIVSFAIEQQFFGTFPSGSPDEQDWDLNLNGKGDPNEDLNHDGLWNQSDCYLRGVHVRHAVNVGLYILSVLLLFQLLSRYLFKNQPDIAFISALIFLIHPIHTEVVANIKSRDEIMSFLFIVSTLLSFCKYLEGRRLAYLFASLACFFLALLSKEYAITLLVLLPSMTLIFSPSFLSRQESSLVSDTPMDSCLRRNDVGVLTLAFFGVFVAYLALRIHSVGIGNGGPQAELLNNPYLLATASERLATILFTPLLYIKLLCFPHPLSADYSYHTIAYRNFASPEVWLSLLVHAGLIFAAIRYSIKRHPLGFALTFYLLNLFLVSNLVLDIGGTMGERLIYHSSLGFAIVVAWGLCTLLEKWSATVKLKQALLIGVLCILTILCGCKTSSRNSEWKNDMTLFLKDVQTVPNAVLANGNAGARSMELADRPQNIKQRSAYLKQAERYLQKALRLHPKYVNGYVNLGLVYLKMGQPDLAKSTWDQAKAIYPDYAFLAHCYSLLNQNYTQAGFKYGSQGKLDLAIASFKKAVDQNPSDAQLWYNLGRAYAVNKQFEKAREAWNTALKLDPNNGDAKKGLVLLQRVTQR